MKNIVICSDGTGNSAIKDRGTNVFKLYEAVDVNAHKYDDSKTEQIAFYDDGVGTESFKPVKIASGAFGWGLSRNVKQLYAELVRVYDPGDKIFLFGFSRGAFTVRTLAGFVLRRGLIDRNQFKKDSELTGAVNDAYTDYRKHYRTWIQRKLSSGEVQYQTRCAFLRDSVTIEFVGVWDTVDAVGMPMDILANLIDNLVYRFKFPDNTLNPSVKKACHAISVDDERMTFHPVLWDESRGSERIEQVWFPGVHSNVGGGYPKQGMSLVSLAWTMDHAASHGLNFVDSERQRYRELQNVHDKLYDSRAGLASYYRYGLRDIEAQCRLANIPTPKLHASLLERIAIGSESYAPTNLPPKFQIVPSFDWPAAAPQIAEMVERWLRVDNPCKRTKFLQRIRELLHLLFIGSSLLGVGIVLLREIFTSGWTGLLDRIQAGETTSILWHSIWPVPWPLLLAILFLLAGTIIKGRMTNISSCFWFDKRETLRHLIKGGQVKGEKDGMA